MTESQIESQTDVQGWANVPHPLTTSPLSMQMELGLGRAGRPKGRETGRRDGCYKRFYSAERTSDLARLPRPSDRPPSLISSPPLHVSEAFFPVLDVLEQTVSLFLLPKCQEEDLFENPLLLLRRTYGRIECSLPTYILPSTSA